MGWLSNLIHAAAREREKRELIAGDLANTLARLDIVEAQRDYLQEEMDRLIMYVDFLLPTHDDGYTATEIVDAAIESLSNIDNLRADYYDARRRLATIAL